MIIFKKRDKNIYLITNYKVMYSTLESQDNLIRVYSNRRLYLWAMTSWISPYSKFYLVVRNPFDRIVSFYKSKFIKAEKNRIEMLENEKGKWQLCTEFFFPYLGLNKGMDSSVVSRKLMSTKFEEVISILPHVFMKDEHMKPQYLARKLILNKYGVLLNIPIKFETVFKIENKEDLKKMIAIFNIDISVKRNNTDDIKENIMLDMNSTKIIANLYKKDIEYFNY